MLTLFVYLYKEARKDGLDRLKNIKIEYEIHRILQSIDATAA